MSMKSKKRIYQGMTLRLSAGDVITSKNGILIQSPISENWYLVKKMKILGDGQMMALEKEPAESRELGEGER